MAINLNIYLPPQKNLAHEVQNLQHTAAIKIMGFGALGALPTGCERGQVTILLSFRLYKAGIMLLLLGGFYEIKLAENLAQGLEHLSKYLVSIRVQGMELELGLKQTECGRYCGVTQ